MLNIKAERHFVHWSRNAPKKVNDGISLFPRFKIKNITFFLLKRIQFGFYADLKSRTLVFLFKGWGLHFWTILNRKLYFFFVIWLNRLLSQTIHLDDSETVGYYRSMSDRTVSGSRSRLCLTKEIRSESSESDDFQTVGCYRFLSDTTLSRIRSRRFLTKEIWSESSESDDRRLTKNTVNNRKMMEKIWLDLFVVSSWIFILSDRIRPCEIDLR